MRALLQAKGQCPPCLMTVQASRYGDEWPNQRRELNLKWEWALEEADRPWVVAGFNWGVGRMVFFHGLRDTGRIIQIS